jgi:hypothetical protein
LRQVRALGPVGIESKCVGKFSVRTGIDIDEGIVKGPDKTWKCAPERFVDTAVQAEVVIGLRTVALSVKETGIDVPVLRQLD